MRLPVSEHGADLWRELTVDLVGEDVLNATFHEQVLSQEMGESLLTPVKHRNDNPAVALASVAKLHYLLYPQAQVEDAVGAVGLAVWTSHLLDEAGQSKAELSRVAKQDVFIDGDWPDGSEAVGWTTGKREEGVISVCWKWLFAEVCFLAENQANAIDSITVYQST